MHVTAPPDTDELQRRLQPGTLMRVLTAAQASGMGPGYPHWDKLRHVSPPQELTSETWWLGLKFARNVGRRWLPLVDGEGHAFSYVLPDEVFRLLHYVDQHCSGEVAMAEVVTTDEQAREHYLVNSLMEEAIRSSQLEGATTSRRVAKELLRSGRRPKNRGEKMILNNYRALQFMHDQMGSVLTPAVVLELHRLLTEGTLEDPSAAGRLQTAEEERIAVIDPSDGRVLHAPPPADELPGRLDSLCAFANATADDDDAPFVHPVVRAILLHFMLAYDHPFADGNGRTARALFYWHMRTHGYWLVEYLSISRILREAPAQYSRAFLHTETDEGDTTYFLLHQLQTIRRAVEELHRYLERKAKEIRRVERLLHGATGFNHRQIALLSDALRDGSRTSTFTEHATSHRVTHETARADLGDLAERGLLERTLVGRQHVFGAPADLSLRLQRLGKAS